MNQARRPRSEPPEPVEREFGRYQLKFRVAAGGMGEVYLAHLRTHAEFEKWVAIKTIHQNRVGDERFVKMFMREARILSSIDHPNVCTVFDFGEHRGTYYLAMEYLHGETLSALIRRARSDGETIPLPVLLRVISDAARGLHAGHELRLPDGSDGSVVHRDVSPQNIFVLYEGLTKVVDFGIARTETPSGGGDLTATGELKGKFPYMSPEQVRTETLDRRTDVFALGAVMWEALTGKRLFRKETDVETLYAVLHEEIAPPSSIRTDCPPMLDGIVLRALSRDLTERFQTADELARAVGDFLASAAMRAEHSDVSDYMKANFSRRMERREQLLRDHSRWSVVPVVELESGSSLPRTSAEGDETVAERPRIIGAEPVRERTREEAAPAASKTGLSIAAGLALIALLAFGYVQLTSSDTSATTGDADTETGSAEPGSVSSEELDPEPRAGSQADAGSEAEAERVEMPSETEPPPAPEQETPRTTMNRMTRMRRGMNAMATEEPRDEPDAPMMTTMFGPDLMTDYEEVE